MKYLFPAIVAWAASQGLKHLFGLLGRNRRIFNSASAWLLPSGGMPSVHSATVVAFTVYVGLIEGWDSGLFGLSVLFAAIVMYDSMRVRYSSGRQGELLNSVLRTLKTKLCPIRVVHGHTPIEVLAGAVVGVLVALVVFFTTK